MTLDGTARFNINTRSITVNGGKLYLTIKNILTKPARSSLYLVVLVSENVQEVVAEWTLTATWTKPIGVKASYVTKNKSFCFDKQKSHPNGTAHMSNTWQRDRIRYLHQHNILDGNCNLIFFVTNKA